LISSDEFILNKLHLTSVAAGSVLRKSHNLQAHLRADLESAATVALVKAVKSGERRDGHLMMKMKRAVRDCIDKTASTIRIPDRTRQDAQGNGLPIPDIKCTGLRNDYEDPQSGDPLTAVLECCRDDRERKIIQLKAARHTDAHIAKQVGVSRSRVTQIIADIERRYDGDECGSDSPFTKFEQARAMPINCRCGEPIENRFANETRCEDCVADDAFKYHGRSQRANLKAA
jgi:hypothetical protein